jgi:hypothetical protein
MALSKSQSSKDRLNQRSLPFRPQTRPEASRLINEYDLLIYKIRDRINYLEGTCGPVSQPIVL